VKGLAASIEDGFAGWNGSTRLDVGWEDNLNALDCGRDHNVIWENNLKALLVGRRGNIEITSERRMR